MRIKNYLRFIATSLLIISCSSSKHLKNQKKLGHFELYSYPESIPQKYSKPNLIISAFNDTNGKSNTKLTSQYLNILKNKYQDKVLTIHAGSFLSQTAKTQGIINDLKPLKIDIANMGLNELKLNHSSSSYPGVLTIPMRKANFPLVNSNLIDLYRGKSIRWHGVRKSRILRKNGIKIGIIGSLSPKVALKEFDNKMNGFYVKDQAQSILREALWLKKKAVDMIIVLSAGGIDCTHKASKKSNISPYKVNFDPEDTSGCDLDSPLAKVLQKMPENLIDLVLTSAIDTKTNNYIHNIPVVQNYGSEYMSLIEVKLPKSRKDKLKVYPHQPVKICSLFYVDTNDCFDEEKDQGSKTKAAQFLEAQITHSKE